MASTDKKIRMTIVLANPEYFSFHSKVESICANHTRIVRALIRGWTTGAIVIEDGKASSRRKA